MANIQKATFGAGCFWHVQHAFDELSGVTSTEVGYAGGEEEDVTYEEVCAGGTGHAEVCQVEYDPDKIAYEELLAAFWEVHDPTQIDRQGPDVGRQYRSVIFYHSDDQKEKAEQSKQKLEESGIYKKPIATSIEPITTYCRAEEYHQKYFEKTGRKIC